MFSCGVVLFILLTGVPPFNVPDFKDPYFNYIMSNEEGIKNLLIRWNLINRVSPLALDLLTNLICPSNIRYTAHEAITHPYIFEDNNYFN